MIQWVEQCVQVSNFVEIWKWTTNLKHTTDSSILILKQKCHQCLFDLLQTTSIQQTMLPKHNWETVLQLESWKEDFVRNEFVPITESWKQSELKQPELYQLCSKVLWKWMSLQPQEWLEKNAQLMLQYKLLQISKPWLEYLNQILEYSPHLFTEQVFSAIIN